MSAIDNTIKDLEKEFEGFISPLDELEEIETIPFGIRSLDSIIGHGGIPLGMITEIFGVESCGKTSLALRLISEAQKKGLKCGFIDAELAMTRELAQKAGVDTHQLIIARPLTGEEAFEVMESFIEKGIKLVVVDSVSSLVPADELEADYSQQSIGLQARLMSKGMRKIIGCANQNKAAIVFINQIRDDINKMGFGPKTTTSGGRALKFYSALRLQVARTGWYLSGGAKSGMNIVVKTIKNKLHQPQLETNIIFKFDVGFDIADDLLNQLVIENKLKLIGRTYYLVDGNTAIGTKEKAIIYLKENNIH